MTDISGTSSATRIAVLRISFDSVGEKFEVQEAGDGWSAFVGADGTRLEISPRGDALLVRFAGAVGALAASFGELWLGHQEPRGVAVHDEIPTGEDYESLVADASFEGGLFAQAASMLGGNKADADASPAQAEASEGEDAGEGGAFDGIADQLMSAVAKRSSRKVLAARLAAGQGDKDLGDVLDAMEAPEAEGEDALVEEVEGRFAFDPEHAEMAKLLGRSLETDVSEAESEPAEGEDEADKADEAEEH